MLLANRWIPPPPGAATTPGASKAQAWSPVSAHVFEGVFHDAA
ncbi:hypothetical protein RK21_03221 [Pseudomonas plecoglossicida]|nr:hypothetical protein RK21_03221 [Pseudomonas plecoglossicida]